MKCIIYKRVSTKEQDNGLEAQRIDCFEWIEKNCPNVDILEFTDKVSGTDKDRKLLDNRPQLVEALDHLTKGDILLVQKRDRIGRCPYLNATIERAVEKCEARLVCTDCDEDVDDPSNVLMKRILDAFAEYEALMISMRTKKALAVIKSRGIRLGRVPYGRKSSEDGKLVVNLEEYHILKAMYSYRVYEGMSFREIARLLNDQGYTNRGNTWTHGATSRVYKNYLDVCEMVR